MKVTTSELFTKELSELSLSVQFSSIDDKVGIFIFYFVTKEDGELVCMQASNYFQLFNALHNQYIEGEEASDIIRQINQYEDYWKLTYEEEYTDADTVINDYNDFINDLREELSRLDDEDLEEII